MNVVQKFSLSGGVSSLAFDATGDQVAVAVGMSPPYLLRPPDTPLEPQVLLYHLSDGQMRHQDTIPLRSDAEAQAKWEDGKVAYLDERTLLVAAKVNRTVTDQDVVLLALDLPTGRERGRWTYPGFFERILSDLVPVPPHHALISLRSTVLCVDVEAFEEVCSARAVEDGDVVEEDAVPEEYLVPNGLAFDPAEGIAHLLCGAHAEAILLRCRLDLPARAFIRESRRAFPEFQDRVGLCLTPGGGLTLSFQMADALVDLEGRPITGSEDTRRELLARPRQESPAPPRTAPLGFLSLLPEDTSAEPRRVDFDSDFARDFSSEPFNVTDDAGQPVHVGYRYSAGDVRLTLAHGDFLTKPVYIDDHRVALGTPSGILLCIDTATGQSEAVHDLHSRINALQFHPDKRLLLAGGEDGTVTVLDMDDITHHGR